MSIVVPPQTIKIDINSKLAQQATCIANVKDLGTRRINVELYANNVAFDISGKTATANMVTNGFLVAEDVACEVNANVVTVPIDGENISYSGLMLVELKIADSNNVIMTPIAFKVRVTPSILENANVFEKSLGTTAEIIKEIAAARGKYTSLEKAVNAKADKTDVDNALALKQTKSNMFNEKRNLTDKETSYPSIKYLENYYFDMDDVDEFLALKADQTELKEKQTSNYLSNTVSSMSDFLAMNSTDTIYTGRMQGFSTNFGEKSDNSVKGFRMWFVLAGIINPEWYRIVAFDDGTLWRAKRASPNFTQIISSMKEVNAKFDELVENILEMPKCVNSVDEMIDTSKQYILSSTGTIWEYKNATTVKKVTEQIEGGFIDNARLGSDGSVQSGYQGYVTTPMIDLLEYPVPFTLHLDGGIFLPSVSDSYTRIASYTAEQTKIACVNAIRSGVKSTVNVSDSDIIVDDNNNVSILFDEIPKTNNSNNDGVLKYIRFSGKGISTGVNVYITYEAEVTGEQWIDTGAKYSGNSGGIDAQTAQKIATLNNEGADSATLTLLPLPVLNFYNSAAYPSNNYTTSHLTKITYPCRADVPVPFTVKWEHNENAMRTTVAVDTKAIGTLNANTMLTYDATGLDNYPIYNLLPNKMYYYMVTHILSDGSLIKAKSGNFTTSSETIRLLYVEGTQNVRDLGGWTGLNGKKVKYGKLFRGASFSDSSYPSLMLTGKGRLALAELKVQAELNLGATDTETSISSNCAYKKLYYTNYSVAITDSTARTNFKTLLEWIVSCLDGTLSVSGLETVARNIYIHCQGGCDRTGTLCFLLLGLLGVSESDLAKEYELSSFSSIGLGRLRTTKKAVDGYDYVGMVEALKQYSGTTITEKFVDFATSGCNVSMEKINKFRELMLE